MTTEISLQKWHTRSDEKKSILQVTVLLLNLLLPDICLAQEKTTSGNKEPKIVNIVNFIRDIEPREAHVTKDVLYQTAVKQIELMNEHHLGGTFLLQYDALIDPRLFDGHSYQLNITKGAFEKLENGALYRIRPEGQRIVLKMADK